MGSDLSPMKADKFAIIVVSFVILVAVLGLSLAVARAIRATNADRMNTVFAFMLRPGTNTMAATLPQGVYICSLTDDPFSPLRSDTSGRELQASFALAEHDGVRLEVRSNSSIRLHSDGKSRIRLNCVYTGEFQDVYLVCRPTF